MKKPPESTAFIPFLTSLLYKNVALQNAFGCVQDLFFVRRDSWIHLSMGLLFLRGGSCRYKTSSVKGGLQKKSFFWGVIFLVFGQGVSAQSTPPLSKKCVQAYQFARYEQFTRALALLDSKECPLMATYIKWRELKYPQNGASFEDHYAFLTRHTDWPHLRLIRKNMEKRTPQTLSGSVLLRWFQNNPPSTVEGVTLYARLLSQQGRQDQSLSVLRQFWVTQTQDLEMAKKFYALHKEKIREQDHWERISEHLWEGKNISEDPFLKVLTLDHQMKAQKRLAFQKVPEAGGKKGAASYEDFQGDEGILFDHLKWYRRFDETKALDFYLSIRSQIKTHLDFWMKEKLILVRDAMRHRRYQEAYALVAHHTLKGGKFFAESEWLAGFIAYRFLNKPKIALVHFNRILQVVQNTSSITQALYWGSLAHEALGNRGESRLWLQRGSAYPTTFYGQLCGDRGGMKNLLVLKPIQTRSSLAYQKIKSHPFAKIVQWLKEQGDSQESGSFLYLLMTRSKTMEDKKAVVEFASLHAPLHTVELVDVLEDTADFMYDVGYPLLQKVKWRVGIDKALIHAIIRKESKFNPSVTSWKGAIGMMQLMPKTGEEIAKKMKLKKYHPELLYDFNKNLEFGQYYVEKIYKEYNNLALFLAAYNAGPGTVDRKWIPLLGDPRKGDIDELTWIELLPFSQTRHYIKKVTANYRIFKKGRGPL